MKSKSALVLEWCKENRIVNLITFYEGALSHYDDVYGTTDECADTIIGGFDAEQNYHKLPENIFKEKVSNRKKK